MAIKNINKILIANRGEIASRIIQTCSRLGITSVAVFADPDRSAPFVGEADEAFAIGGNSPLGSYLDQEKILNAAQQTGADAIHPGYGFLSENAEFAQKCLDSGFIFIGPDPKAIEIMGSKRKARELMEEHGVPVVPGYHGEHQEEQRLLKEARNIGFPVLLKAVAGGGGRGMRKVLDEEEMKPAILAAKREAKSSFGDDRLIVEKYIWSGRHIEFQVFGDQQGNLVHMFERECTLQRRYQKVIEESPSPALNASLRKKMAEAALKVAETIDYTNAGTVEFILTPKEEFYFLEMNTRLQVEHPVTEAVTGLDLVEWQIRVAEGRELPLKQKEIRTEGFALECRLYAEDPERDFIPVTGTMGKWQIPLIDGIRVDAGIKTGQEITVFYDPMLAKIIAHGPDRATVFAKMGQALGNLVCLGLQTNLGLLQALIADPLVQEGKYDTHFIVDRIDPDALAQVSQENLDFALVAAFLARWAERESKRKLLRAIPSGWRNNFYAPQQESFSFNEKEIRLDYRLTGDKFQVDIETRKLEIQLIDSEGDRIQFSMGPLRYHACTAFSGQKAFVFKPGYGQIMLGIVPRFPEISAAEDVGGYEAPMPGEVVKVLVKAGQQVKAGEELLILSSMKMENSLHAKTGGVVEEVFVAENAFVEAGTVLLRMSAEEG